MHPFWTPYPLSHEDLEQFIADRIHDGEVASETKLLRLAEPCAIKCYQTLRLVDEISPKTINNEILALSAILQEANVWHRVARGIAR